MEEQYDTRQSRVLEVRKVKGREKRQLSGDKRSRNRKQKHYLETNNGIRRAGRVL